MAVLLHEKLIRSMQGKLRRHELGDPSVFTDKVDKLMSSGTNVKSKSAKPGGNTAKKAPIKKKASTSRPKKAKSV